MKKYFIYFFSLVFISVNASSLNDFSILKKQKFNSGPFYNWSLMAKKYKRGGGDFKTYGQLGLFTSTNFKGKPGIGPILSFEKGEDLAFGANLGLLFYFNDNATAFRMPINGFVRYYLSGGGEGFFPEATLGLDYYHSKTNGIISVSVNSTNLALSFGAGFKSGNFIIGANYYMIMSTITGKAFLFKAGLAF